MLQTYKSLDIVYHHYTEWTLVTVRKYLGNGCYFGRLGESDHIVGRYELDERVL